MRKEITIPGYIITETLHEGKDTIVYRGRCERDNHAVVLKTLVDNYAGSTKISLLSGEFDLLKNLGIAGVTKVCDLLSIENRPVLVMEDAGDHSIEGYYNTNGSDHLCFLETAIKITDILSRIHAKDIIHKNINPANILINSSTGNISIIDFALAAKQSQAAGQDVYQMEGTLAYISPEQTGRMNRSVDYRTDLYSLGITFYEMLTGRLPFQTSDAMEMVHCHIAKKIEPLTDVDPQIPKILSDIVLKLTAKNPEDRYQSAAGLKHDLERCMENLRANLVDSYFAIGENDLSAAFRIPTRVYGREKELDVLKESCDLVANGWCELMLISGPSGIGKTALVQEIQQPAAGRKGYFISGKLDQFKSNIPFSAFTQAFSDLFRQLISEPAEKLERIKNDLFEALGLNASILTDLIPEFKLIIGKQDAAYELNPPESQNRFFFTLNDFIRVFARPEHPLTIFLDDLQWCDDSSMRLIRELIIKEIPYLFIIGAYRNNEIREGHPLALAIEEIKKTKRIQEVTIGPLGEQHINQLIADTLMGDLQETGELAKILFKRTAGNPFYIKELLKTMYHEQLIHFEYPDGRWKWDMAKITSLNIAENVVAFMMERLKELPDDCLALLKTGSCIGNSFHLISLSQIANKPASEIAGILWPAVDEEIIRSSRGSYRMLSKEQETHLIYKFQHDRIQQAAYLLIDESKRSALNLAIGRILLQHATEAEKQEKIIELTRHFNEGRLLITNAAEKIKLAEMNLLAGKKAQAAVAYDSALQYFKTGIAMLPASAWQQHYSLTFELYAGYAQNAYQVNDFSTADESIGLLLEAAKTRIEKLAILSMKVRQYNTVGKAEEAINAGIEGLGLLGIKLARNPGAFAVLKEVLLAKYHLGKRKPADLLNAPLLEDAEKKAVGRLLTEIAPSAYILGDDNLWAITQLKVVNLSLVYGNYPESAYAYIAFGTILKELFGDLKAAEEFGKVSLALNEKFGDIEFRCRLIAAYGVLTHHFNHHWNTTSDWFRKGIEAGYFSGDVFFLAHCAVNSTVWNPSLKLSVSLQEQQKYLQLVKETEFTDAYDTALMNIQLTKNVMGLTESELSLNDEQFNEEACLQEMTRRKYLSGIGMYHIHKAEVFLYYEEYEKAFHEIEAADKFVKSMVSLIYLTRLCSVAFFSCSGYLLSDTKAPVAKLKKRMKKELGRMTKWAAYNEQNFLHHQLLMEAELARVEGNHLKAEALYDKAISAANRNQWPADEAFANEVAARFYSSRGQEKAASGYWREAVYLYDLHGAAGKIRYLKRSYPQHFRMFKMKATSEEQSLETSFAMDDESSQSLDVAAITKSSQAISEEIVLESLLGKMMRIIMMNAGAEKGILLLEHQEKLYIQATGAGDVVSTMQNIPAKENDKLPQTIINYVSHLHEPVVLDDAGKEGDFVNDKYIQEKKPKSVLCSPILLLNKLYGIIYLENNITTGAFTKDRLQTLQLLSSQMAISIQNAMMYANLEEEVLARTRELTEEKKKSDDLLYNILPEGVANELKRTGSAEAKLFDHTTVLFTDFVNFTRISESLTPKALVAEVHHCFTAFDDIIERNGLEKIKTIGDAYLAVCGLPEPNNEHAINAVNAALQIMDFIKDRKATGGLFEVRIGISSGPVVAGIVGVKKFVYDIWSDTVNTAARMESNSETGRINISAATYELIKDHFTCTHRGIMDVKSKGMLEMYFVDGRRNAH